jgi:serine/threonine protein kinase
MGAAVTDDGRLVAGRYRLGHRIGSGAMGIVWQAHDQRLHRIVAVKQLLLQPGLAESDTDEAKRRAMREGRIAARLQHPHAIAVYDVAEDDGQPWLVMEYLPSKSLSTVLSERGTLSPRDVASIGQQVASALSAAHNAGIVHRDIKPGNILLGDEGVVKITDFGISRATGDVTVTATGMLAGTPAYLAPEVAKGYDPGSPSDVFSLGSTLYAAIEGAPPFGLNENTIALLHQVASGKVNPPKQAGPLTALLMRLLRPEPEDRPTMAEAREALAAVAAGRAAPEFPMSVPPVSPPSWRGAPVSQNSATRAMAPASASHTPPPSPQGTRIEARPSRQQPQHQPQQAFQQPAPTPRRPAGRPTAKETASKRSTIITALAIVAAAVVGIMLASFLSSGDSTQNASEPGTSATQDPNGGAQQPSTPQSKPKQPKTTGYTAAPTEEELESILVTYFELAPQYPQDAWSLLNGAFQGRVSGGFDNYQAYWDTIESVDLTKVRYNGDFTFNAEVVYTKKDGSKTIEPKLYSFEWAGPNVLISSEQANGAVREG